MKQNNDTLVWAACFLTVINAIYWSLSYVLNRPSPLYIAFLLINVVSLITVIICFVVDIRKKKSNNSENQNDKEV